MNSAKKSFSSVPNEAVEIVSERCLDKRFKIRKEAATGLAVLYNQVVNRAAASMVNGSPGSTAATVGGDTSSSSLEDNGNAASVAQQPDDDDVRSLMQFYFLSLTWSKYKNNPKVFQFIQEADLLGTDATC